MLVIPDLTQDSRTAENPLVTGEPNIRFYAGAPLRMPNGQVVGSLCVIDIKPRPHGLTAGQLDSLQRLSRQVVWFLQERRLRALIVAREENIRQAFARQLALTDLGDKLRDLDTPASMTAAAAKLVGETFHASRAGYGDLDATGEFVDIVDDWTVDGSSVLVGRHRLSDYGDIASLIARGDPVVIDDVDTNPHIASRVQAFHDLNIRSLLNVPLQERGRTIGVFYIHNAVARMWTPEEVGFARDIASRVQVGIARIRAEDHQRTLNNELSHRMKNVLAMVQAIATQTMRSAVDLESARAALDARLVTMGKAHDILLAGRVDATNLDAVVRSALVFGDLDRFHIAGPFIKVGSKAALSLALMFHELATNAAKYGALASCDGTVTVTWTIDTGAFERTGVLNTGASNVGASERERFRADHASAVDGVRRSAREDACAQRFWQSPHRARARGRRRRPREPDLSDGRPCLRFRGCGVGPAGGHVSPAKLRPNATLFRPCLLRGKPMLPTSESARAECGRAEPPGAKWPGASPLSVHWPKRRMSLEKDMPMRTFDLSPLYRSTVGFDRMFNLLDQVTAAEAPSYPPYNIERTGENAYRITVAVAGFSDKELSIETRENTLTIKGAKDAPADRRAESLYQGIAARAFERRFQLADHVSVTGAQLENGLLHVELVREIPEAQKPRQIPIGAALKANDNIVEAKAA